MKFEIWFDEDENSYTLFCRLGKTKKELDLLIGNSRLIKIFDAKNLDDAIIYKDKYIKKLTQIK